MPSIDWPGEKLCIRLSEILLEKGIGGLLAPYQMRRVAKAQIGIRTQEIVEIAKAEKEALDIRAGKRDHLWIEPMLLKGPDSLDVLSQHVPPSPNVLYERTVRLDALRKEVNVAQAALSAEDSLEGNAGSVPEQAPDADWLYRWRDYAGATSDGDLQKIWGAVLAGELLQPGATSLRTLDFLRSLSKEEALLIEKTAPYVISRCICIEQNVIHTMEAVFNDLLALEALGLVNGVTGLLSRNFKVSPKEEPALLVAKRRGIALFGHSVDFSLRMCSVTELGNQVFSLCSVDTDEEYLKALGNVAKERGSQVFLGNVERLEGNAEIVKLVDALEL